MKIPGLIAHRGYAQNFPENTSLAIEAALRAGACGVEFDVQLSADRIPVLMHDADLQRTAGVNARVMDMKFSELEKISVHEPNRFGHKFTQTTISSLADIVSLLQAWPLCTPYVEIKEESLDKHGTDRAVKNVIHVLKPVLERCVIISYNMLALHCARAMGAQRIGWVLPAWNEETMLNATKLTPDFLFCNYKKLPPAPVELWRGPWQWAVYEIIDPELALLLAERGIQHVETMAIREMLEHPVLRLGGCFG